MYQDWNSSFLYLKPVYLFMLVSFFLFNEMDHHNLEIVNGLDFKIVLGYVHVRKLCSLKS